MRPWTDGRGGSGRARDDQGNCWPGQFLNEDKGDPAGGGQYCDGQGPDQRHSQLWELPRVQVPRRNVRNRWKADIRLLTIQWLGFVRPTLEGELPRHHRRETSGFHHSRTVSWQTSIPRSNRRSSTLRGLSGTQTIHHDHHEPDGGTR